jgi:nicotinamidase/pyrazinamidase
MTHENKITRAVICVDIQKDFLPGGALAVPNGDEIIDPLTTAILSISPDWVIATRDWHPANHCSFKENGGIWPAHCVERTPGAELDPTVRLLAETLISKGRDPEREAYSGFDDTRLADLLRLLEVHEIFVAGLATDYCVKATVLDGLKEGFTVYVLEDCCRAVNILPDDGKAAIKEMEEAGAKIITNQDLL